MTVTLSFLEKYKEYKQRTKQRFVHPLVLCSLFSALSCKA